MAEIKTLWFEHGEKEPTFANPHTPEWAEKAIAQLVSNRAELREEDLTEDFCVLTNTPDGVLVNTETTTFRVVKSKNVTERLIS